MLCVTKALLKWSKWK